MVRIVGVDVPDNKRFEVALTVIYGIGKSLAGGLCYRLGIDPLVKTRDIDEAKISEVRSALSAMVLGGDLKREMSAKIQKLVAVSSYRGIRHSKRLPVRGQRTRTNAKTAKGGRKPAIANKKKATK